MSKKPPIHQPKGGCRKHLIDLLRKVSHRYGLHNVWSDFIEISALAISNSVDLYQYEKREARYMQIVGKYQQNEMEMLKEAYHTLVDVMEEAVFDDVLGSIFMELELSNKWTGQFFTPYTLCRAMGLTVVDDQTQEIIRENGFIRVSDPCVGGGAMPIAMANTLFDMKINPQQCMHVTAQDLDEKAVHMAYIQLSLLYIPAVVIHGNTLALEERAHWFTPAHILGGWSRKLSTNTFVGPSPSSTVMPHIQTDLFEVAA